MKMIQKSLNIFEGQIKSAQNSQEIYEAMELAQAALFNRCQKDPELRDQLNDLLDHAQELYEDALSDEN